LLLLLLLRLTLVVGELEHGETVRL